MALASCHNPASRPTAPHGFGLGLRPPHYPEVLAGAPLGEAPRASSSSLSTPGPVSQASEPDEIDAAEGGDGLKEQVKAVERIPGLRLLMVSTTGEHAAWFTLDAALQPQPAPMPAAVQAIVDRIGENCEPALCSVLFVGGAGGSLRAGVTDNPVRLTRAVKQALVTVSCGGAPAYVWPGGGITVMVDVTQMPAGSFGTVPTPAIVAPRR